MVNHSFMSLERSGDNSILRPSGIWKLVNAESIDHEIQELNSSKGISVVLDGSSLDELDTCGAMLLKRTLVRLGCDVANVSLVNFKQKHQGIVGLVKDRLAAQEKLGIVHRLSVLQVIGRAALAFYNHTTSFISFLGEAVWQLQLTILKPKLFRIKECVVQLERVGVDAIPVVCLVTGLIGVVLAYLFAEQLKKYGGNIFIVDGVSIAMCRELSPLIVAIVLAGRSGSAFTAQLGTMKINEEIDAMVTLGLSPMQVLVLPRIFALVITMPLLVFVGSAAGTLGGMFIANLSLGLTTATFIARLQVALPLKMVWVGLGKAPVFAAVIALIGCRMGLTVENNARSVGLHTTSTVVQSIVAVILIDAAFAVIFQELGI
jgi:phospholipid/cholesterol/gamma-HCH transport system permease protein